jgi:hypothetical protein
LSFFEIVRNPWTGSEEEKKCGERSNLSEDEGIFVVKPRPSNLSLIITGFFGLFVGWWWCWYLYVFFRLKLPSNS